MVHRKFSFKYLADLINEGNFQAHSNLVYQSVQTSEGDLATFICILKLFIGFDSKIPFLSIYAKEIITAICNN